MKPATTPFSLKIRAEIALKCVTACARERDECHKWRAQFVVAMKQNENTKSAARYLTALVRILLGLMFLVFGLNGFLNFMPTPKDMPQDIMTVFGALTNAGYMTVVSGAEVLIAVMLLTNRFVPLALATIGPGIVVLVMELYLAWAYRGAFRPMLAAKTSPGAK